jgi:peptide/nickel transport system permease protein
MFFVLVIAFLTVRYSGEPFEAMFPQGITIEHEQALKKQWLLDRPMVEQFSIYFGRILQGDFGRSLFSHEKVWKIYASRMPATLAVGSLALLLAIALGIPIGALAALRRGHSSERVAMGFAFLGYAVPHFVLGIGLILCFGYYARLLPASGLDSPVHYILPVLTLSIPMLAAIARFMRAAMLDAIGQEYVMTAHSKGIPSTRIVRVHILRNAMIPLLTVLGLEVAGLANGSVFVEAVFSLPGVGRVLINSVENRDFPVLQFGVIAYAGIVVCINLVIDLLYTVVDPRIRVEG